MSMLLACYLVAQIDIAFTKAAVIKYTPSGSLRVCLDDIAGYFIICQILKKPAISGQPF
jgi:hypothetical protein